MKKTLVRLGKLVFPDTAHSVLAQELGPTSFQLVSRAVLRPLVLSGLQEASTEPAFKAAFDALIGETMNRVIAGHLEKEIVEDATIESLRSLFHGVGDAILCELPKRLAVRAVADAPLKEKMSEALAPRLAPERLRFRMLATFDATSLTNEPNLPEAQWRSARIALRKAVTKR